MHKDQTRVKEVLLSQIMDRVLGTTPQAERDCTILNRLLIQGPDPLYIMETCPEEFRRMCRTLKLPEALGRDAIESAHWRGPGVLLEGLGLPNEFDLVKPEGGIPDSWKREALWLVLASMSDCTEEGYGDDRPMLERIQRANQAVTKFTSLADWWAMPGDILDAAVESLRSFTQNTMFKTDGRGLLHATEDHAFYVAYKGGAKVCAVHTNGPTFWGTTPDTSLAEQGVTVDKVLSPQFGLVFDNSREIFDKMP